MLVLLIVVLVVAGIALFLLVRKRGDASAPAGPVDPFADKDSDALRGDPRALKAGDIVDIFGETYTVRGSLRLKEGGYQWSEHLLDTAKGTRKWLSVEEDPDLELVLWTETPGVPAAGGDAIEYDGKTFQLDESGRAQYVSEATTGLTPSGTVAYHDYTAADDTRLSFEDFGESGKKEAAIGQVLYRSAIMIYPQSSN
ncbi:DUF4178 domain-containing protein [Nocardia jinanensis]|uniref:DUF4178 domain-containing protein n=1 Tax=Nocardia jinanensis TaxID=382504 RepID=A0A917RF41_9NOCA|nr:DUF4178 domain-containing protein [Nocardia jinanensis]GGL05463.1 hypothetical protein GCM10011588_19960 [Nocardia jinanensis]